MTLSTYSTVSPSNAVPVRFAENRTEPSTPVDAVVAPPPAVTAPLGPPPATTVTFGPAREAVKGRTFASAVTTWFRVETPLATASVSRFVAAS